MLKVPTSSMQPISVFLFCCLFSRFNNPTKANLILFQLVYDTFCAGRVVLWRRQSYTDNTYYLCRLANFIYCCQRMLRESPVGIIPGLRRATQRNSPFFAHLVWNINGMIYRQIFTRHTWRHNECWKSKRINQTGAELHASMPHTEMLQSIKTDADRLRNAHTIANRDVKEYTKRMCVKHNNLVLEHVKTLPYDYQRLQTQLLCSFMFVASFACVLQCYLKRWRRYDSCLAWMRECVVLDLLFEELIFLSHTLFPSWRTNIALDFPETLSLSLSLFLSRPFPRRLLCLSSYPRHRFLLNTRHTQQKQVGSFPPQDCESKQTRIQ